MNKQNVLLEVVHILNTYSTKIPKRQLELLLTRNIVPLFQDSKLAQNSAFLIGKIMGDGNLDKRYTCRFIGQINDLNSLKIFLTENFSIRENSIKISYRENIGKSYLLQVNDSLLGRYLYALGAPMGNKTNNPFLVPNWIILSEKCKKSYLQGIFDDELATIKIKREKFGREATFRMAKIEKYQDNLTTFLQQIKDLTESLSVACGPIGQPHFENLHKNGEKTFSQCFRILGNKENLFKFHKNIGFALNEQKKVELENCVRFLLKK